jgi:hypothetical protein
MPLGRFVQHVTGGLTDANWRHGRSAWRAIGMWMLNDQPDLMNRLAKQRYIQMNAGAHFISATVDSRGDLVSDAFTWTEDTRL